MLELVINKAHTTKRLSKQLCLLGVTSKQKDSKPKEEARTGSAYADALSLPALKRRGLTEISDDLGW